MYPGALCVSALRGNGRDELVAAMESHLALDTATVTLEFEAGNDADRDAIGQVYRVGRILRHVTTDGRIIIEAELPRRVAERFGRSSAPRRTATGQW
jgi:50S ribosomal subunit-associated GTPase HflX